MKLTKTKSVQELIAYKNALAMDERSLAMLPKASSLPEFFLATETSPFHQPTKPQARLFTDCELLPVRKIGKVAVTNQSYPVSTAYISNGKKLLQLHVAGLN